MKNQTFEFTIDQVATIVSSVEKSIVNRQEFLISFGDKLSEKDKKMMLTLINDGKELLRYMGFNEFITIQEII